MIIVWRGWGLVALVVPVLVLVSIAPLVDGVAGAGYWAAHPVVQAAALVAAGVVVVAFGRRLNGAHYASGGAERRAHTCMFVPVEWWGVALAVLGPLVVLTA